MRRRRLPVAAITATMLVVAVGTAACHPGTSTSSIREMATCSPSGTNLRIVAQNLRFDRDCLAAPAGQAFILRLDNDENGIPHNVSIYPNGEKSSAREPEILVVCECNWTDQRHFLKSDWHRRVAA